MREARARVARVTSLRSSTAATGAGAASLTFHGAIKSMDVEDPVNLFVHRPIQLVVARVAFALGVTANQATIVALCAGLGAAAALAHGSPPSLIAAGGLLFASAIWDGVDGMLARARGIGSPAGHVLDVTSDYAVNVATTLAGAWYLGPRIGWPAAVLLALGAHAASAMHVMIYDFYATHYLRLGMQSRSGAGVPALGRELFDAARHETGFSAGARKLLFASYVWQLGNRRQLIAQLNPGVEDLYDGLEATGARSERYRRHHRWPMRATAWLGNAMHMDVFALCIVVGRPDLYFALRIVAFGALAIGQTIWHRVVSARYLADEARHAPIPGVEGLVQRARALAWLAGIVGAAAVLYAPALASGFMFDDHVLLTTLEQMPAAFTRELNLFSQVASPHQLEVLRHHGLVPWWASPELVINFWRPIPSITHWVDWQLWGYAPLLSHAVSISLYLVVVILAHRFFARVSPGRSRLALLATAVFALDECHALVVQWVANRSELICSAFALLSLLAFLDYKETGRRAAAWLSWGAFLLALLSRETAVAVPLFVVAHEIWLPARPQSDASLGGRLRPRLRYLAAMSLTAIVFASLYVASGHGGSSAYYVHPIHAPGAFAAGLPRSVLLDNALLLTGLPLHLLGPGAMRDYPVGLALVLAFCAAFWWLAFRWLWREPPFRFFVAWSGVTMLLFNSAYPDPRYLFLASIGLAWIVARMIEVAWDRRTSARGYLWALRGLVALHLVAAPALAEASVQVVDGFDRDYETLRTSMVDVVDFRHLDPRGTQVFFVDWNRPEISVAFGLYLRHVLPTGPRDRSALLRNARRSVVDRQDAGFALDRVHYYLLSMMDGSERTTRVGERELEISPTHGAYFRSRYEQIVTTGAPYRAGQSIDAGPFVATVRNVDEAGRIMRVRFRFAEPLGSPRYRFVRFDGARFVRVRP